MVKCDLPAALFHAPGKRKYAVPVVSYCSARRGSRVRNSCMEAPYTLANEEKSMSQGQHSQEAELRIRAACSHIAAERQHNTSDHLDAQELDRTASDQSQEAARLSKKLAKHLADQIKN